MKRDFILVAALWLVLTAIGESLATFVDIYPAASSDKGEDIEHAFRVLVYFAVPVFTLVIAVLLYTLLTRRTVGVPEEDGPPLHGRGSVPLAWFVASAALTVTVMVYPGLIEVPAIFGVEDHVDLVVEVEGAQWTWFVSYPEHDVERVNELVLPVDRTVRFEINSLDVLHSFWIPAFLMKIDAVPGRTTEFSLRTTQIGSFETDSAFRVQCTELCGLAHGKMRIPVRVVPEAEFNAWVEARKSPPEPTDGGPPADAENVTAGLSEFAVSLSQDSVPAGSVIFDVKNDGAIVHNVNVAATDLDPGSLPVDESTYTVDISQVNVAVRSRDLDPGQSESVWDELDPGTYVLFCNIPTHYQGGMFTEFTVESP